MAKEEKTPETDFKGPVSLDAIFAATKGKTEVKKEEPPVPPITKEEIDKTTKTEPIKKEEPPVVKEEPKKEEPIAPAAPVPGEESTAFKTAQRLIELGMLEDFAIQTSEEDENGTLLSEFTEMTDDNLEEIIKIHKQEKAKEISDKFLPKGDLKEHQLKVFEILSNGGDLSEIADTPEKALERPFEGFDMDDQKRQIDVRYAELVHNKKLDHENAITIIDKEVKSGTIKDKALENFNSWRQAHSDYINGKLEEQKKAKEFKELNLKENKKVLTAKLKESGLKESVYKKVASEYAKRNENGEHALLDKLREALNSPEENHELILHLADKKLFNETFKIKASHEAHKTIVKLASGAASKGNRQTSKTQKPEVDAPWLIAAQKHNENIKNK